MPIKIVISVACFQMTTCAVIWYGNRFCWTSAVSSMQLALAEPGFRMRDGAARHAHEPGRPLGGGFVNEAKKRMIVIFLFQYGEERASRRIAKPLCAPAKTLRSSTR